MDIVYLQCDLRYNPYLLKNAGGGYIIQHTISRIKELNCTKIIAGIYECAENSPLIEMLRSEKIKVILSDDNNVNSRFLSSVIEENADYVVRVGGDQCLFDAEMIKYLLGEMKKQNSEWFYGEAAASVLPDIVSIECLRKYKREILTEERYFMALEKEESVRRYCLPYPYLVLYDFRANTYVSTKICRHVIEKGLDIRKLTITMATGLLNKKNYMNTTGIWGSWVFADSGEIFFYDEEGNVNPWLGRTVIDLIKKNLTPGLRVFEWGSGNSTLFWSRYVEKVVSVEYNREWFERISEIVPQNAMVKYYPLEYNGEYCRAILEEEGQFDIILIDGRDRVRCAQNAVERLQQNGIILWDNTEREYYRKGYDFLKEKGFKRLELSGILYGNTGTACFTSIFYRENNFWNL